VVGVIIGMEMMDYVRENMNRGEKVYGNIGFPQSYGITTFQVVVSTLEKDFEVIFIHG